MMIRLQSATTIPQSNSYFLLLDAPPMESLDSSKYCKDLDGSLRTERGGITTTMVS